MSASFIISVTLAEQQPRANDPVIAKAQPRGGSGDHVVPLDANSCSALPSQWGLSSLGPMRSWRVGFAAAPQGPLNPRDSIGPHPGELRGLKDQDLRD